jgi:hypothetical protein
MMQAGFHCVIEDACLFGDLGRREPAVAGVYDHGAVEPVLHRRRAPSDRPGQRGITGSAHGGKIPPIRTIHSIAMPIIC